MGHQRRESRRESHQGHLWRTAGIRQASRLDHARRCAPRSRRQGYRLLTISNENPIALRDINSLDYLCAGRNPACPKPSLADSVLKQIEQREEHGVHTHILAFHELSTTAAMMPKLIIALKAPGYRLVTLSEYMHLVARPPVIQRRANGNSHRAC